MTEYKKVYENIEYGGKLDTYKYVGMQKCLGVMPDFPIYVGKKYKHNPSLDMILELENLKELQGHKKGLYVQGCNYMKK